MHTAFLLNGQGIAARLPRLIREREDKKPFDCTTAHFVHERFVEQPDRQEEGDDDIIMISSEC